MYALVPVRVRLPVIVLMLWKTLPMSFALFNVMTLALSSPLAVEVMFPDASITMAAVDDVLPDSFEPMLMSELLPEVVCNLMFDAAISPVVVSEPSEVTCREPANVEAPRFIGLLVALSMKALLAVISNVPAAVLKGALSVPTSPAAESVILGLLSSGLPELSMFPPPVVVNFREPSAPIPATVKLPFTRRSKVVEALPESTVREPSC